MVDIYYKERTNKLLWFFLILSLILNIIGLFIIVYNLYFQKSIVLVNLKIDIVFRSLIFIFSIFCIYKFKKQNLALITLVLPTWNVVVYLIAIILGIILVPFYLKYGITPYQVFESHIFIWINNLLGLGSTILNVYLMFLFKKI